MRKTYKDFVKELLPFIKEIFPWDLKEKIQKSPPGSVLLLDIREPYEFDLMKIENSINVPRGILEAACDYDYEETVPQLVEARETDIVIICRSGNRSVLAANTLLQMGYKSVVSLKTGLRGWNDSEESLVDSKGRKVSQEEADEYFNRLPDEEKRSPRHS